MLKRLQEKLGNGRWEGMSEKGEKCWVEDCGEV